MGEKLRLTASTGNVFRDLGFRGEEAAHLLIRTDLMIQAQKFIATRKLKQLDLFSTDALIDMLARLGARVRLTVKPGRRTFKVA